MLIDSKKIVNEILKTVKVRTTALNLQNVYPALALIRTSKSSYHKYYMTTLKKYCRECGVKLNVIDILSNNKEDAIQVIDKYNSDFGVHGIVLETPDENLANNIVPFKDVDALSIPSAGSLMTKEEIVQPCIPKGIISMLRYFKVDLKHSRALIITDDDNNYYVKYMSEMLRREKTTVIIANKNTYNLSSMFYDSNIILIANHKQNSIGYELLDDVNYELEQNVIHNIATKPTYVIDLNIHKNSHNELNGNIQYNNTDDMYKYEYLKHVYVLPVGDYINLALGSLLQNTLKCASIQNKMLTRTSSYI